ncbi:hypothetical protein Sme01_50870 [Sphaerisporangium melleum]|uniref:Uncharacterized protein n=1 Tax=Sphaerisporangium melleum TaxID=321316 RepID=A0A917QX84_9ACTN|nr:hypothetical protein [Sphaerisporangium melleum]GGK75257.1 hypothetical protein GCM10007964_17620 [Sphaerisporangium melleum]GII72611.1 hypothetical protein Sme01_50870 [Sphaerisporangium melleum]
MRVRHHKESRTATAGSGPVRRLGVQVSTAVLLGSLASVPALAAAAPAHAAAAVSSVREGGDGRPIHVNTGNGRRNNSYAAVYSPTVARGQQLVTNTITGGYSRTHTALCKHQRMCVIKQKSRIHHRTANHGHTNRGARQ